VTGAVQGFKSQRRHFKGTITSDVATVDFWDMGNLVSGTATFTYGESYDLSGTISPSGATWSAASGIELPGADARKLCLWSPEETGICLNFPMDHLMSFVLISNRKKHCRILGE
jgi:hypothetical protein